MGKGDCEQVSNLRRAIADRWGTDHRKRETSSARPKEGGIEVYSASHYLTVTGQKIKSKPATIESCQEAIDWLLETHFRQRGEPKSTNGNSAWHPFDKDLLEKAFAAKNCEKLKRLFNGDTSGHRDDDSAADLGLCSMLAFWTQDPAQIDRIFRRSGLMRDKWDSRRGDSTYGAWTINKALAGGKERYAQRSNANGGQRREQVTRSPLRGNDLPVTCSEEENTGEHEDNIVFPEAAWTGLFGRWRDITAPCTEAPLESLWGALLLAAGMIIGRNAWRESPRPLYPNFYLLLVGQTGDSRKSTVMWLACQLLRHVGEDFKELDGVVSSEGIYEALADHEETKALIYADEFRALLSVAKRKGTQDILPRLNSLYYCPERASIDRVKDSTTIVKPFLSLVTATPQAYVEDILTDLEIVGGFLNRFLIISGEEQEPKAIVKSPSVAAWESIASGLGEIRDRRPGHLEFSPEASELWIDFYTQWKKERRNWHPKKADLSARTFEHILKIAIVYAVLAGEHRITEKFLAVAIRIGGWLQANALTLFADSGADRFGKCERTIIDLLKHAKNFRMWRRDLQQAMSKRGFNGEMFSRAIKALEANDLLRCDTATTPAGRTRPFVEYISEQVTGKSASSKDSSVTCSQEEQPNERL